MQINWQKYVTHPLQGLIVHTLFFFVRLLPLDVASWLGGKIARTIGPRLSLSKVARQNLTRAFPEKTEDEIEKIIPDMWENLGRVAFEFPRVTELDIFGDHSRVEVVNGHYLTQFATDGKSGIFFSGHLANWEVPPLAAVQNDPSIPIHLIYREPDNPFMRNLFAKRLPSEDSGLIPKGAKGARMAMSALKEGKHLAMLVDQKMNDGIAVPFFGRDAMTAPAIAQFALKYDCPVVPVQIIRTQGARFKLIFYPPVEIEKTGNRKDDIYRFMCVVNGYLEGWIRQEPGQWLWVHRRWPKEG